MQRKDVNKAVSYLSFWRDGLPLAKASGRTRIGRARNSFTIATVLCLVRFFFLHGPMLNLLTYQYFNVKISCRSGPNHLFTFRVVNVLTSKVVSTLP